VLSGFKHTRVISKKSSHVTCAVSLSTNTHSADNVAPAVMKHYSLNFPKTHTASKVHSYTQLKS